MCGSCMHGVGSKLEMNDSQIYTLREFISAAVDRVAMALDTEALGDRGDTRD